MNSKPLPCKYYLDGACHHGDACKFSHQKPSTICRYFLKGKCAYGDKCSLLHKAGPTKPGSSGGGSGSDSKKAGPDLRSNAFSASEKESDGSDVGWGQNADDQRDTESGLWNDDTLDDQQSERDHENENAKAPCHFFRMGMCGKGDSCNFAHSTPSSGAREAADVKAPPSAPTSTVRRKEICKQYMMDRCQMGALCRLKHPKKAKQKASDTTSARVQNSSTLRSSQPADPTVSVPLEPALVSPSATGLMEDNEKDVNDAQDTDTEPINADDDNDERSKAQYDSNHDEMDRRKNGAINIPETSTKPILHSEGAQEEIGWPGNPHDEKWTKEIQPGPSLPSVPQQRIYEPTQSPTIYYPHVSEINLQVHWSQFADPLANPEIAFCKLHAQGQCVQGESCRFRHSITVEEYILLFRDQQPNLWTLSRDPNAQHTPHHHKASPLSFSALSPPTPGYPQLSLPQPPPGPLVQSAPSPFSQECKFYPLGTCRNGDSCPYLHAKPSVDVDNNTRNSEQFERSTPDALAPSQLKSGRQLCKYFASKRGCTRGDSCSFSHGDPSSDSYPSSGPSGPQSSTSPIVDDNNNGWSTNWDTNETPNYGNNDADNNSWGDPPDQSGWTVDTSSWDQLASTSHSKDSKKPKKVEVDEWPPTDDSSRSAPWVVADPALCPHHARGTCRKGARCPFRHDLEARTADTTDDQSKHQYETSQPSLEESEDTSQVQNADEDEDNRWAGDEEIEVANGDEELYPNEAEPQDSEELASEPEQVSEPVSTSVLEHPHPEVKMFIMRCDVSFGPDALPDHITTATETNKLVLSNLPLDVSPTDVETLVNPYGAVRKSISLDETEDSSSIEVEFYDQGEARAAFKNLEGYEYEGRNVRTSLQTPMVAVVRNPTQNLNLKVSWPSPYVVAWSHYPTITKAKEEADRINGVIIRGRITVVTFVTPKKNQKNSFAIRLENLGLEIEKSDLEDVCLGNTLITIEKPSYSLDATNSIRMLLGELGPMEDFDTEPRTSATSISRAFVMFRNEGVAKQAVRELDAQVQDFIGGQALKVLPIYYSRFRIPRALFDAIKTDLDLLKAKCEEGSKKCTIQYYDHRDRKFVWVRVYSPTASHSLFAEINNALVFLVEGTVLRSNGQEICDKYFETSSSANALEKIQEKTATFIHYDQRGKKIRIFGARSCQEDAQKSLMKLIGKVHMQRHEIDLPRPMLRPIVDNGFKSLQNDVGMNKVSIDVVHSKLIVRGSTEDVTKAHNTIATFDTDPQAVRDDHGRCQICHCDPIDSIILSCRHAYCKACLRFAIKQPAQTPFCCISERTFPDGHITRCEIPLGYGLIQNYFPFERDELLRASFFHHIRSRREHLFFCPSLECEAVHRAGEESVNIKCSLCVAEICTFCKSHAHVGLSCAERKALVRM